MLKCTWCIGQALLWVPQPWATPLGPCCAQATCQDQKPQIYPPNQFPLSVNKHLFRFHSRLICLRFKTTCMKINMEERWLQEKPTISPGLQMKVIFVSKPFLSLSGHLSPSMYVMMMFLPSKCGASATAPTRIEKTNSTEDVIVLKAVASLDYN